MPFVNPADPDCRVGFVVASGFGVVCMRYGADDYEIVDESVGLIETEYVEPPETTICIEWSVEDVDSVAPDLTTEEQLDVLHMAKCNHDANIGINWDVLRENASWVRDERTSS